MTKPVYPPIEIWTGLGTLSFDYPSLTTPHPHQKLKFQQDLALSVLTTPCYYCPPPPPPFIEIWTELGTLSFDYPSLPPKKIKFGQDLATLSYVFTTPVTPPPHIELHGARM